MKKHILKNTTFLEISIIFTLSIQVIGIFLYSFFALAVINIGNNVIGTNEENLGGYKYQNLLEIIKTMKTVIFFLFGLSLTGFILTMAIIYYIHNAATRQQKLNPLFCYIFIIFSTITTIIGGVFFVLWYRKY